MSDAATVPSPGSDAAHEAGCICPRMDNGRGKGYLGGEPDPATGKPMFVIADNAACTHDPAQYVTADEGTSYCPACEARPDSFDSGPGGQITHMHEPDIAAERFHAGHGQRAPHPNCPVCQEVKDRVGGLAFPTPGAAHPASSTPARSAALSHGQLRTLALAARDAFPGWDWPTARHCSKGSIAYVVSDNDAPHSDPTGAFCDAVSPDVLLALLDEVEVDRG